MLAGGNEQAVARGGADRRGNGGEREAERSGRGSMTGCGEGVEWRKGRVTVEGKGGRDGPKEKLRERER